MDEILLPQSPVFKGFLKAEPLRVGGWEVRPEESFVPPLFSPIKFLAPKFPPFLVHRFSVPKTYFFKNFWPRKFFPVALTGKIPLENFLRPLELALRASERKVYECG
jgi:hypothetical protein